MRHFGKLLVVIVLLWTSIAFRTPEFQVHEYHHENVLGTSMELKVAAYTEDQADRAEETALNELDRLDDVFSTYKSDSEISRWLATYHREVKVSPELFEVLQLFESWNQKTSGALNASVSQATEVWKKAATTGAIPSANQLQMLVNEMQQPQWKLNASSATAMHLSHQSLALNSFVKSYIIDKVSKRVMSQPGVKGVVVNIGGDICVSGDVNEVVSIVNPLANAENSRVMSMIHAQNKFIATSGNYRRGFNVNGQWYSHIIDPRTAIPVSEIISATVIADNGTDAGALATAFNVLLPEESRKLASRTGNVDYLIITKDNDVIKSEGWDALVTDIRDQNGDALQSGDFEASIDLALATFEGRFRRPFVAVWVENKKKESVKTIALWYNKPRWIPDLKRWYSKNQEVATDYGRMSSISSATRSAGKYTLVWDGLTDTGEAAPEGKYTLYIEAAREHGTYQLIKQEFEWNKKSAHFNLEGGIEITSAAFDLHNKAK